MPFCIQAGLASSAHTLVRILAASLPCRLLEPSRNPNRLRRLGLVSPGSLSRMKPSCDQRMRAAPRAAAAMAAAACRVTALSSLQNWTATSPLEMAGSSRSLLKAGMSASGEGRCIASP